jgi:hypothetical protein
VKGFDLYEQWRSCVYQVSGFIAPSWDALEIWERVAWEKFSETLKPLPLSGKEFERQWRGP